MLHYLTVSANGKGVVVEVAIDLHAITMIQLSVSNLSFHAPIITYIEPIARTT